MVVDWQVAKSRHVCEVTGRELAVGEEYFSALKEDGDGFSRLDCSIDAWDRIDQDELFSFWRTRVQARTEENPRRLRIDVEAFYTFFRNLVDSEEERHQVFLYLVALILTRKRALRLDEIEKTPDGDYLMLYDRRADARVRVFCPEVSDNELQAAQEQLNQIFECQVVGDIEDLN